MAGAIEKGMSWCYPQKDSFKKALRNVYQGFEEKKETALQLQDHLCKKFTTENQHSSMVKAIQSAYESKVQWNEDVTEIQVL